MRDYELETITPLRISELREKGKRSWFTVTAEGRLQFACFNRYLYPAFKVGQPIVVEVAMGNRGAIINQVKDFLPDYPEKDEKAPYNPAEAVLFQLMIDSGWELTKKGWPDFACFKDGKLVLIEVKPKRSHRLKVWQRKLMLALSNNGIQCYRWSPDGGFEPILEYVKFPIDLP